MNLKEEFVSYSRHVDTYVLREIYFAREILEGTRDFHVSSQIFFH